MTNAFEIEIKTLLGDAEKASEFRDRIVSKGAILEGKNNQLNHYFHCNDLTKFKDTLLPHIPEHKNESFTKILEEGGDFSVRTRELDGKVILVIKASIGIDSSANGVSRMEFECQMPMSLDDLDELLLSAGLAYQAKWSREREEYSLGSTTVCLDKNAGYGYLAEFEKVISEREAAAGVREDLLALMRECGVEELSQERLERMFSYYNSNWQDYYGTDKVFNIE